MIETRNKFKGRAANLAKSSCLKFALAASVCLFPLGGRTATNPNPTGSGNNFYFTPYGSQLDDDMNGVHNPLPGSNNVYDIVIGPNKIRDFKLYIADKFQPNMGDFMGFPEQGGLLKNIKFEFEWDNNEYVYNDFVKDDAVCALGSLSVPGPGDPPKTLELTLYGCSIPVTKGLPQDFIELGFVRGTTVNPGLFPHDGDDDFKATLKTLVLQPNPTPSTPTNISSSQFQDVELQNVPGPLPLLGVGAAFGFSRNLRKRIKTSKSPEAMSALG